jgi:hypothetical protein
MSLLLALLLQSAEWRRVATDDDRARLRGWRSAWVEALARARAGGAGEPLARDPELFDPDRALPRAALPAGDYRCRTIKVGAKQPGMLDYVAYPAFRCRVVEEGRVDGLAKLTGSQRQMGRLYEDTDARQVFLGTLVLGDETRPMAYGRDRQRDVAGFVERIGPARWRLVLPYPRFESVVDVVELVPER